MLASIKDKLQIMSYKAKAIAYERVQRQSLKEVWSTDYTIISTHIWKAVYNSAFRIYQHMDTLQKHGT